LSAKTISTILSAAVTYLLHGFWTFRHRGGSRRSLITISLFGLVTVAGLFLSLGIVGFSHYFLGYTSLLANNVANSIALVVSALVRFFATRQLVFSNRKNFRTEGGQT
jgi:putative flippase GtrA